MVNLLENGARITIHGGVEFGENADEFGEDIAVLLQPTTVDARMDSFEMAEVCAGI